MNRAEQMLFAIFVVSIMILFIATPYRPSIFPSPLIEEEIGEETKPIVPSVDVVPGLREFGTLTPRIEKGELREEYEYPMYVQSATGIYRQVLPGTYPYYPLYYPGVVPVPTPQRYRFHQPYYHRLHTNYPYYDPVYDSELEPRDYCLKYPGCHPCPHWSWMSAPYCPNARRR